MSVFTFLKDNEYDVADSHMNGGTATSSALVVKDDMFDAHHYFSMIMLARERQIQRYSAPIIVPSDDYDIPAWHSYWRS